MTAQTPTEELKELYPRLSKEQFRLAQVYAKARPLRGRPKRKSLPESRATSQGFLCSHVNHLGLTGLKDWQLKAAILEGDWTFITNNSMDFRGPEKKPGSQGIYAGIALHAGLICIDAPGGLNLERQKLLFQLILSNLEEHGDLTNQVLQVTLLTIGAVELGRYEIPASENDLG